MSSQQIEQATSWGRLLVGIVEVAKPAASYILSGRADPKVKQLQDNGTVLGQVKT
jgi:hypothetical protein